MFNIIETPRNYFTREFYHTTISAVMWHFTSTASHRRPYLVVSCSEEVFCRPSTAAVVVPLSHTKHRCEILHGLNRGVKAQVGYGQFEKARIQDTRQLTQVQELL